MMKLRELFTKKVVAEKGIIATAPVTELDPAKELAFYESMVKTGFFMTFEALRMQIAEELKSPVSTQAEKNAKCDAINLMILKAQLERQTAAPGAKSIKLSIAGLTRVSPEMVLALKAHAPFETITDLSLCDGKLSSLPAEIKELSNLRILHLTNNDFSTAPSADILPAKLGLLGLRSNPITDVGKTYHKDLTVNVDQKRVAAKKV